MRACFTYIIKDGEPIPEPNILAWAEWMNVNENQRRVAFVEVGKAKVSTVFLGTAIKDPPMLLETMIFGGPHNFEREQYCTLEEAMLGHEHMVAMVLAGEGETG